MENDPRLVSRQSGVLAAAALIFLAATLFREPYPSEDSAFFEYVGRALSEGRHLYTDLWDNKLPSVYLVNLAWWKLFGSNYLLHAFAEAAVCLVTVVLFALILRRFGVAAWPAGVALFTFFYMSNGASLNQTERYATPLILGSVVFMLANRPVFSATILVLASTFWVPSFVTSAIPLLLLASRRERIYFGLASVAAACALVAAMVAVFGTSTCRELLQSWTAYEAGNYTARDPGEPHHLVPWLSSWAYYIQSGLLLLAALVATFWKGAKSPRRRWALLWSINTIVVVFALGKPFVHYFLSSYAPLVLLLVLQPLNPKMFRRRWYFGGVALVAFVLMAAVAVRDFRRDDRATLRALEYTGSAIKREYGAGVLAVLPWEAYLSSDAIPPSRFYMARLVSSFAGERDKWVVVPRLYADTDDQRFTKLRPPVGLLESCGNRQTQPLRIFVDTPMRTLPCFVRSSSARRASSPQGL